MCPNPTSTLPEAVAANVPADMVPADMPPERMRVAYQGEPGAYSEQATLKFFEKRGEPSFVPCATFRDMFEALHHGRVDRAAVPIENSLAGTIHENLDLLLRYRDFTIVGELDFRVSHCLLALKGTQMSDITVVRSHHMALSQCTAYLRSNGLVPEVAYDTAGSAKRIAKDNLTGVAAIASRRAAEIYGLGIVDEDIEDEKENFTRFLILSKESVPYVPGTPSKTSLVFSLINGPGVLCRALSVFAVTNIDLTKIESRHIHTVAEALQHESTEDLDANVERRWGYVFYVDIARHAEEPSVSSALKHLQEITAFYRVLGSYPKHCREIHD